MRWALGVCDYVRASRKQDRRDMEQGGRRVLWGKRCKSQPRLGHESTESCELGAVCCDSDPSPPLCLAVLKDKAATRPRPLH